MDNILQQPNWPNQKQYIKTIEDRQGFLVGSPDEIAWRMGWIDSSQLKKLAKPISKSAYGKYLDRICHYVANPSVFLA